MKRVLTLGITDPLRRVVVWLAGCAVSSLAGAIVGVFASVVVIALFVVLVASRMRNA